MLLWLSKNKVVSKAEFARVVLERSPSTFSDLMNKTQSPRSSRKEVWEKMTEFLDDENAQNDLKRRSNNAGTIVANILKDGNLSFLEYFQS